MIELAATDDNFMVTAHSGSHPLPGGTEEEIGTCTRVVVADRDYIGCDLTATERARQAAALSGSRGRHRRHCE